MSDISSNWVEVKVGLMLHSGFISRGSYMSDRVLLNLLNKLVERDKMRGL